MKKLTTFLLLLLLGSIITACGAKENTKEEADKLTIYTTVFPLLDFTKKIGGENISVKSVYPLGAEAHSFEPTPKDMTKIADADAFIYTGVGVEGFVNSALKTLKNEKVMLVEAGNGIEYIQTEEHAHQEDEDEDEHEDEHGNVDPHVWLDPIHSITLAENIKNALIKLNPDSTKTYEKNFLALKGELETLHTEFQQVTDKANTKEILVAHAAYGYWESRYGIEQISITGFSPSNEPSQKELKGIIETAKEHDLKYIIFEQNISSKIGETVQKETGTKPLTLHNLEGITEKEKEKNVDYFSIMKQNLETLKIALK